MQNIVIMVLTFKCVRPGDIRSPRSSYQEECYVIRHRNRTGLPDAPDHRGSGGGLLDGNGQQEIIYITMVSKFFPLFIAGIFLSAILAAIMSTADSQLLVTASALTKDFYHNKIRPQATEKELMWVSRGCVMGVAVIAVLIATNQNSTVLGLVSYAWGGFGSAFGPLVLCSLFWKRTNKQGAYAGILVGGIVDLVWAQLSGGIFDLYEIVPGFVCGLIAIFVVSLLTAAPSKEITDEFDSYRSCEE